MTAPDEVLTPLPAGPAIDPRNAATVGTAAGSRAGGGPGRVPRFGEKPAKATSLIILIVAGVVFLGPILAMVAFSFRSNQGGYTTGHYTDVFNPTLAYTYDGLFSGIGNSLVLCLITVAIVLVLLLPVMILVELRYPKLRRVLEFVCLLPITIPTVVLVVGFIPVYSVVAQVFGSDAWTLGFAIGVIAIPYAFRPISVNLAGVDVTTLSEAARSLGASWLQVMARVIIPNLRRGILSATFITIAVVLGEYTIASFLGRNTFQTALVLIQHTDPYVAVIFSLLALILAFVLLLIIGRFGAIRPRSKD
jgi:putative spermidine/putrescine transport system permease protein